MKINVSKNEILSKLRIVGKIVKPSRETMYNTFFFRTENESQITVIGSDESGCIETTIDCKIEEFKEVSFLIDSGILLNGLKELSEQPLVIEITAYSIIVKYKNGKFEIAQQDAKLYPVVKIGDKPQSHIISAQVLMKGFKTVSRFASADEMRPVMTAVNIIAGSKEIAFAATNSHVLCIQKESIESDAAFNVNVPAKISRLLLDILPECENVEFIVTSSNARFVIGGYTVTYRLIEGRFPNYNSVIPTSNSSVSIDCNDLIAAISRVSVFANDATTMIVLDIKDNTLSLTGEDIDYRRKANETMMLGELCQPIEIGFKGTFLQESLKTVSADSSIADIHFAGPTTAAIIRPHNNENTTIILMPMQVAN